MTTLLAMIDSPGELLELLGSCLLYLACFGIPAAILSVVAHLLLSMPLRRRERARMFLELVETALSQGKPVEQTLVSAADSRDPSPGARFHLVAEYIREGLRLGEALRKVPRLLPPQITAMIQAGERAGDLRKVLPACRQLLNDSVSQVRGALNYLILVAFVVTPMTIIVPFYLTRTILPKYNEIFVGMGVSRMPEFTTFVFQHSDWLNVLEIGLLVLIWISIIGYAGGPRIRSWIGRVLPGAPDRFLCLFPWRRKRLERDFSTMLCVLLDANVPELEAVTLAAETTANAVFRRRAAKVCEQLARGVALPVAIRTLDDAGELQWRLTNALQRGRDFLRALTGWHEALDARAFQQEQAAAQLATSALVVFNGVAIASVVIAVFLPLADLVEKMTIW